MNFFSLKYPLVCAATVSAAVANAADPMDLGQLSPDTLYEYELLVPFMGYYTPEDSGIVRCYSTGDEIAAYEDADHQTEIFSTQSFYNADGEKVRIYPAVQGQTLYFFNPAPIAEGTFRFTVGKEDIKVSNVTPAVSDTPMSISTNYSAVIEFNIPIKCTKCVIECNGVNEELSPVVVDSSVTINWIATLKQWYRDGKIGQGDELTLTLTGIRDVNDSNNRPDFGDGRGKLVLKYNIAGRPTELLREVGTPNAGVRDMLSYYLPDGEDGLVKLVFSSPLDPGCRPEAQIQYGDPNNIELGLYHEYPPVSIEGETLTVDLRGVKRLPEEMVPGLTPQNDIALRVSNIKSADGQYVLTGSMANPYSFGFSYNLRTVVYSIAADWVPVAGSQLVAGEEMEIWVLNAGKIQFDSVDFSYLKDAQPAMVSVPYADLRVEEDPYSSDALLYYLPAPALDADPDSEITVSFGGLECADGLDHTSDILVRYRSATSGVDAVESAASDAVYYDLTGRRVKNPSKGIYISNGKKTVIK